MGFDTENVIVESLAMDKEVLYGSPVRFNAKPFVSKWGEFDSFAQKIPKPLIKGINAIASKLRVKIRGLEFEYKCAKRDCCTMENGKIITHPEGEVQGAGGVIIKFAGYNIPVPLWALTLPCGEIDLLFATVRLDFQIGLFYDFNVSFKGNIGSRFNKCLKIDCFYGGANARFRQQIDAEAKVKHCFSFTNKEFENDCKEIHILLAGLWFQPSIGIVYNPKSCDDGCLVSIKVSNNRLVSQFKFKFWGYEYRYRFEKILPGWGWSMRVF